MGKRRLLLATKNQGKVQELKRLLEGTGVEVVDLSHFPGIEMPEETGRTFEENARIKALAVASASGLWALADDSGLLVDALGGEPGVHSARWTGEHATDETNNARLLERLAGVPAEQRTARFVSAVALCSTSGECVVRRGACEGVIGTAIHGSGGFGYDPLFYSPEEKATFAELSASRKNEISHRARAFAAVKADILARVGGPES